jgi:C1A family cysteine protease
MKKPSTPTKPSSLTATPIKVKKVDGVRRVLNCITSPGQQDDWKFEHALAASIVAAPAKLPPSVDLRESWWNVGDQRETGSCVGWASADSLLRWHFVKANKIATKDRVSVRFIWMASKETDEYRSEPSTFIENAGTSLKAALDIARKYGAVKEPVLPFDSGHLFPGDEETFYAIAAQLKIKSYFNLGGDLAKWRAWLANNGPILTRLEVDTTWDNAKATKGNLDTYDAANTRGGHAVSIVGYTANRFIVRNSWGTKLWGDKGFGYASLGYAQEAFTEAYGITV